MASGKVHITQGLIATGILTCLALTEQTINSYSLAAGCGFGTWFLNPDNDLPSKITKHWGPLKFIWSPYMDVTTHRSWTTHFPIISTLFRVIYLYSWFLLPNIFLYIHYLYTGIDYSYYEETTNWLVSNWQSIGWFFIGLCINDTLHWVADGCPIKLKL